MPRREMDVAEKLSAQAREAAKADARYRKNYDRELEKRITKYRKSTPAVFRKAAKGEKPRTILAEGDSWMRYCVGHAIAHHLEEFDDRNHMLNIASPGDTASEIMNGSSVKRLKRELDRGPGRNRKYDVLVFSAGGNDILDKTAFRTFLNDYKPGMKPKQVVNKVTLNVALKLLFVHYDKLFAIRDEVSSDTLIYMNIYDYAQPGLGGVLWLGPWLEEPLEDAGVPEAIWAEVVEEFLRHFKSRLQAHLKKAAVKKLW